MLREMPSMKGCCSARTFCTSSFCSAPGPASRRCTGPPASASARSGMGHVGSVVGPSPGFSALASFSTMRCTPIRRAFALSSARSRSRPACGPAELADLGDARAHEHALVGDQHDLVPAAPASRRRRGRCARSAGSRSCPGAAAVAVLDDAGALAVAVLGGGEHADLRCRSPPAATSIAITLCPSSSAMPRTLRALRPIGRTSSRRSGTALLPSENSITSWWPSVRRAPIR